MAVTVTTDLVTLYDGNTAFGGGTIYSGFQRFGTACNGVQVSNKTTHYTGTVTSFSLVGKAIYSWMVGPGSIDVIANGGYRIVIGDGTNTRAYYVGGRDYKSFNSQGWNCFILQGDALPTNYQQIAGAAQPNLNAITLVGVGFTTTSKAVGNSPNCFYDIARYGTGLVVGGGTSSSPGTFNDIRLLDDSLSNAWGIVEDLGGGIFGIQGKLTFGSTTTSTWFEDTGKVIVFEDRTVSSSFYEFKLTGSTTQTNTFILGEKTGTGENAAGINGVTILSPNINVNVDFTNVNIDTLGIYGSTFQGLGNADIKLSNNTTHEFISNNVVNSGRLVANQTFIRNIILISTTSNLGGMVWNDSIDIKKSTFIGNSNAIQHSGSTGSPYSYDSLTFTNNTYDINNTSGSAITVNATNGANPSTYNTANNTVTIVNAKTLTLSGLIPNTEIRIYRLSDSVLLGGIENSSTSFQYQYNYTSDVDVFIHIHNLQYQFIRLEITLTDTDATIPIQQVIDRNYQNPT